MNPRTPVLWLLALLMLSCAAAYVLATESWRVSRGERKHAEFQRLVGGLGLGVDLQLSDCAFSFDPRFRSVCLYGETHLPASNYFCPHHSCSIMYLDSDRVAR